MRPCDCKCTVDSAQLDHQGIASNCEGIMVIGNQVEIKIDRTKVMISVYRFRQWAEWFLEDQCGKETDAEKEVERAR